jgi:acetyl-CoA C-acetyltransferase
MNPSADSIVIVGAKRTPQGRFLGKLSGYSSLDLAIAAGKNALGNIPPSAIDMTIVGNCLPPVLNVSRQMSLKLGIPSDSISYTVNMACASGLKAITLAADALRLNQAETVLCGGTESMSNSPHFLTRARTGYRLGDGVLVDSVLAGLSDPVIGESMVQTAQRLAERFEISRLSQDEYAYSSHCKAVAAQREGRFKDELVVFPELDHDEHPRADTSLERLGSLKSTLGGESKITAGNSSGINDGAAMLVLCKLHTAERNGWQPLALLGDYTEAGCDPKVMGEGPVHAIRRIFSMNGKTFKNYDALEINEAFAAQILACLHQLELCPDDSRLNKHGSGIALGHPVAASGARLAVTLAHRAARNEVQCGIASLCVGGGMGIVAEIQSI